MQARIKYSLHCLLYTSTPREIPGLGQPRTIKGLTRRMIVCCDQFAMEELTLNGEGVVDVPRRQFAGLFLVEGQCRAVSCRPQSRQMGDDELLLTSGQTAFLAAEESILLLGKARAFLFSP